MFQSVIWTPAVSCPGQEQKKLQHPIRPANDVIKATKGLQEWTQLIEWNNGKAGKLSQFQFWFQLSSGAKPHSWELIEVGECQILTSFSSSLESHWHRPQKQTPRLEQSGFLTSPLALQSFSKWLGENTLSYVHSHFWPKCISWQKHAPHMRVPLLEHSEAFFM